LQESGFFDESDPAQLRAAGAQNLGVIMTQLQAMREKPLLAIESGNREGLKSLAPDNWFGLTIPMFAVFFAFFLVSTIASELLKEREEGTLRRLLAAPIHRGYIIAGKTLAYVLIVVLQIGVLFGVGNALFGMSFGNSPAGVLLVTVALALAATSLGMVVAALARSHRQADSVGMVMGFILGGLGGSIQVGLTPLYRSKGLLGMVSQLTPNAHALDAYRQLMIEGAGIAQILPQVGVLLAMAAFFFLVAMWRFRFE
jgi:ABC-2 type transport system permease protein